MSAAADETQKVFPCRITRSIIVCISYCRSGDIWVESRYITWKWQNN